MSEEEASGWVDRQEQAFGELIARGIPDLATAGRDEWLSQRAVNLCQASGITQITQTVPGLEPPHEQSQ